MKSKLTWGALFFALQAGAFSVEAAEVQMYGQVDVGLSYAYTGVALVATGDPLPGQSTGAAAIELEPKNKHFSKLGISSGMMSPSLVGLRGTEALGNGWKVRLVLESGFNADDGSFKTSDKLFDREASLALDAGWATLRFGRLGPFRGAVGSTGLMKDNLSAFGVDGWGTVQGLAGIMGGDFKVLDNVIALEIPVSSSLSVHAMYTGSADDSYRYNPNKQGNYDPEPGEGSVAPTENKSDADRYFSAALLWRGKAATGVLIGDYMDWSSHRGSSDHGARPSSTSDEYHSARSFRSITGLGAWNAGGIEWFGAMQYFESAQTIGGNQLAMPQNDRTRTKVICYGAGGDGFNVTFGTAIPLAGGKLRGSLGWLRAETNENSNQKWGKMHRWIAAVGYDVALSKRTTVYAGVSYMHDSYTYTYTPHGRYFASLPDAWEVGSAIGVRHSF